jgi:hypothetical protein
LRKKCESDAYDACKNHWKKHMYWFEKIFFNNQKEIWSQGRNVESQNFKNRQKKLHFDKQMLDVVYEIEVIMMWSDLIISKIW